MLAREANDLRLCIKEMLSRGWVKASNHRLQRTRVGSAQRISTGAAGPMRRGEPGPLNTP